jgi:hypothetical protein
MVFIIEYGCLINRSLPFAWALETGYFNTGLISPGYLTAQGPSIPTGVWDISK